MKYVQIYSIFLAGFLCFESGCGSTPLPSKKSPRSKKLIPKKSEQLTQSGIIKLGEEMAFFSGLTVSGSGSVPFNSVKYLKKKEKQKVRHFVVSLCASWCAPCKEGLKRLKKHKRLFKKKKIDLLILIADQKEQAQQLYDQYGFKGATFIVDPFETYALKFSPGQSKRQLVLPKTFVLDRQGQVRRIIGTEGQDWIKLLSTLK